MVSPLSLHRVYRLDCDNVSIAEIGCVTSSGLENTVISNRISSSEICLIDRLVALCGLNCLVCILCDTETFKFTDYLFGMYRMIFTFIQRCGNDVGTASNMMLPKSYLIEAVRLSHSSVCSMYFEKQTS